MRINEARKVMDSWLMAERNQLEQAVSVFLAEIGEVIWLDPQWSVFVDPRNSYAQETLWGVHQRSDCNLMPYREVRHRDGRSMYLFEFHIKNLLQTCSG